MALKETEYHTFCTMSLITCRSSWERYCISNNSKHMEFYRLMGSWKQLLVKILKIKIISKKKRKTVKDIICYRIWILSYVSRMSNDLLWSIVSWTLSSSKPYFSLLMSNAHTTRYVVSCLVADRLNSFRAMMLSLLTCHSFFPLHLWKVLLWNFITPRPY